MSRVPLPITFNRPAILGDELELIRQAVEAMHTSGDGGFTRRCSQLLQEQLGVARVLLTPSCTDALEMCALLLDIGPDDEVIVPSFSFVSLVNAFVLRGARPIFADIRPDTLNLDERLLEPLITSRTRAIGVVHYAGVGCEMDAIGEIARRSGCEVVEDNAHGLFGKYRDRPLGTFSRLATLSFHETKNFTCGEGGALLINDPALVERAEIVRDKGTDRQRLYRGEVDKYTWVDLGSSFVLSDILAAFLYAQLLQRETVLRRRREMWQYYDAGLRGELEPLGVRLPAVPPHCEQAYHMYYLVVSSLDERRRLIERLRRAGIFAVFHYTPLHLSRMGLKLGGRPGLCPVTERISDGLVRLPFHQRLTTDEQSRVIDELVGFFKDRV